MSRPLVPVLVPATPAAPRGARWAAAVALWLVAHLSRRQSPSASLPGQSLAPR